MSLRQTDPELAASIGREIERQQTGLELIASENFTSPAVLEAMGTPLTKLSSTNTKTGETRVAYCQPCRTGAATMATPSQRVISPK